MDAVATRPAGKYERHEPEQGLLYQVLAEHLETFLQQARSADHALPAYVERELRAYLECGVLSGGFVRRRCPDGNERRVVAFSCRRGGFCPSCMGRRMADTAARLVDQVLPPVPIRQWVLSFPIEIRYRLAYDGDLLSQVLRPFMEHLNAFYRSQARRDGRSGGIRRRSPGPPTPMPLGQSSPAGLWTPAAVGRGQALFLPENSLGRRHISDGRLPP